MLLENSLENTNIVLRQLSWGIKYLLDKKRKLSLEQSFCHHQGEDRGEKIILQSACLSATRETTQKTFPPTRAHRSNFSDSLYPTMEDELCFWWMEMIEWCYWNSFFDRSFQTNFKNTLSKQKYVWERAFGSIRLKPGNYFFRKYFLKEPNYWNFPLMPPFNLQEKSPNIIKVEYRSWKICLINSF